MKRLPKMPGGFYASAIFLLCVCGVVLSAGEKLPAGETKPELPKTSRVWAKDFEGWEIAPFCGTPSSPLPPAFFQQGPRLESGGGGRPVVGEDGTVYVAAGTIVYRVTPVGRVELLAGTPGISGFRNGPADRALFGGISVLRLGPDGALYTMEPARRCVRKITPQKKGPWTVAVVVGSPRKPARRCDGPAAEASFVKPCGMTIFDDGRLFVMDKDYLRVFQNGQLKTLNPRGGHGYADGPLETARFKIQFTSNCLTSDGKNLLYIADMWNNVLRRIDLKAGTISTVAGGPARGTPGSGTPRGTDPFRDGPAMWARFHPGGGVTTAWLHRGTGNIYMGIADDKPHVLDPTGWLRTLPLGTGLPAAFDKEGRVYTMVGGGLKRLRKLKPGEKPFKLETPPSDEKPLFVRAPFKLQSIPRDVKRVVVAAPAKPPVIDGKPDDECWRRTKPDLLRLHNGEAAPADTAAELRVLADKTHLYLAVRCVEPALSRMKKAARHHDDGRFYNDDYVEFFVIPSPDPRDPAYQVMINNAGQTWDGVNKNARKWNPKLKVAVGREKNAWTVEVALPLKEIPGAAQHNLWRMNVSRWRPRRAGARSRESTWALLYTSSSHAYTRFNLVAVEALGGKLPKTK